MANKLDLFESSKGNLYLGTSSDKAVRFLATKDELKARTNWRQFVEERTTEYGVVFVLIGELTKITDLG